MGAPVEADGPRVNGLDHQMALVPGISRQSRSNGLRTFGLDGQHHPPLFVVKWAAQNDHALVHQLIHEGRVRCPVGLLLQRQCRIKFGT